MNAREYTRYLLFNVTLYFNYKNVKFKKQLPLHFIDKFLSDNSQNNDDDQNYDNFFNLNNEGALSFRLVLISIHIRSYI